VILKIEKIYEENETGEKTENRKSPPLIGPVH
jgi:hypothetical protein